MIDFTPILQALIGLCSALVTAFLIPLIKSKKDKEKYIKLLSLIDVAVAAAEKLYDGSGQGALRKDYVKAFLSENGYNFDSASISDSVNAMIEAAVYNLTSESDKISSDLSELR